MRSLESKIVEYLSPTCDGEPIHAILLGMFDFQISYSIIERIQAMNKVAFSLREKNYVWNGGLCEAPVWLLVGQVPKSFEIITKFTLRMNLASGDYVDFFCDDSPFEDLIIDFGINEDGARVMEIF